MNKRAFRDLPRFDDAKPPLSGLLEALRHGSFRAAETDDDTASEPSVSRITYVRDAGAAPAPMPVTEETAAREEDPEITALPVLGEMLNREIEVLQETVAKLAGAIERIEKETGQRNGEMMRALTARLFPELSKHFLAEEIGRHLPSLLPSAAATVLVRAQPDITERLREMALRHPSLAARLELVEDLSVPGVRVDVSWQTGGIQFDFAPLLESCLAHLSGPIPKSKENK